MSKQYGLIIPKNNKQVSTEPNILVRPSIFGEESDSDSEASKKPTGLKQALKKQDRDLQEKAVAEDPTIFQYDEVYDDIDQKRKESKLARQDIDRKPKYISKLLQAAERRKRENERRIEREVQRERDAEGEEFKDKESFVTSAYRKKLEEMKELEEKEKREEYLESIGDVRKQGNLDGFYRHLYEQKVNYAETSVEEVKENASLKEEVKENASSKAESTANVNTSDSTEKITATTLNKSNCKSQNEQNSESTTKKRPTEESADVSKVQSRKKRKYRHRKQSAGISSDDEKDESGVVEPTKHIQSNLDADSDFTIDTSSESEDEEGSKIQNKTSDEGIKVNTTADIVSTEASDDKTNVDNKTNNEIVKSGEEAKVDEIEKVEEKLKIDIWKKRTVGVIFEEALQRYFQRKALRETATSYSNLCGPIGQPLITNSKMDSQKRLVLNNPTYT